MQINNNLNTEPDDEDPNNVKHKISRSCQDYIIIRLNNPVFIMYNFLIILACIVSSFMYCYLAAFGVPDHGSGMWWIDIMFEAIFGFDILVNFCLEYRPVDSLKMERDWRKIAERYARGLLMFDALA